MRPASRSVPCSPLGGLSSSWSSVPSSSADDQTRVRTRTLPFSMPASPAKPVTPTKRDATWGRQPRFMSRSSPKSPGSRDPEEATLLKPHLSSRISEEESVGSQTRLLHSSGLGESSQLSVGVGSSDDEYEYTDADDEGEGPRPPKPPSPPHKLHTPPKVEWQTLGARWSPKSLKPSPVWQTRLQRSPQEAAREGGAELSEVRLSEEAEVKTRAITRTPRHDDRVS